MIMKITYSTIFITLLHLLFCTEYVWAQDPERVLITVKVYPDLERDILVDSALYGPTRCETFRDSLLVADSKSSHVVIFNLEGEEIGTIGRPGNGPGELHEPIDIKIDRTRQIIWVLDQYYVHAFKPDGTFVSRFRPLIGSGGTLGVLDNGNIVLTTVPSERRGGIVIFNAFGEFVRDFSGPFEFLKTAETQFLYGTSYVEVAFGKIWQITRKFNEIRVFNDIGTTVMETHIDHSTLLANDKYNRARAKIYDIRNTPNYMIYDIESSDNYIWIIATRREFAKDIQDQKFGRLLLKLNQDGELLASYIYKDIALTDIIILKEESPIEAIGIDTLNRQLVWIKEGGINNY